MDIRQLHGAKTRFDAAETYLDQLEASAHDNPEVGDKWRVMWEGFLNEHARGFNKLFYERNDHDPTSVIINQIRQDRKDDPLLAYLRQARNEIEHGIQIVSTETGRARPVRPEDGPPPIVWMEFTTVAEEGKEVVKRITGKDFSLVMENWSFSLCEFFVNGKSIDTPKAHLGNPLKDFSPVGVGRVALIYARARLEEIRHLIE